MSDKRYQVFVSSTFADLKDERAAVVQALMEMDCIPAGMEAFPAVDENQLEFIKSVINDCDYYVLIIGGRYGSVDEKGVSYTQREYEYANELGIPILAFVKRDIANLPLSKTDAGDQTKMNALETFRSDVMQGRLVKLWDSHSELPGLVALGLNKAIKLKPGIGWVRGDTVASEDLLLEINQLRKENQSLKESVVAPIQIDSESLSGLETEITLSGRRKIKAERYMTGRTISWSSTVSLEEIFAFIAPSIRGSLNNAEINNIVGIAAMKTAESSLDYPSSIRVDSDDFNTVMIQLEALGLIGSERRETNIGETVDFSKLSPAGEKLLFELRALKS